MSPQVTFALLAPGYLGSVIGEIVDARCAGTDGTQFDTSAARQQLRAEIRARLPDGVDTPGHELMTINDGGDGRRIGVIWLEHRVEAGRNICMLLYLAIDPGERRRGFASEAVRCVERQAGQQGDVEMRLVVAGANQAAQALYSSLIYRTVEVLMAKPLTILSG